MSTPRELLGIRDDLAKKVAERQLDRHDAVADLHAAAVKYPELLGKLAGDWVCGLPMLGSGLWVPAEARDGDPLCQAVHPWPASPRRYPISCSITWRHREDR